MTATTLPADLDAGRRQFLAITGLSGNDIGALPDPTHKSGGGYHCGCQDIINLAKWATAGSSLADYSVRQARDRIGGNACSAIDVGDNWPNGGRAAWIRFNNMLVAQMRARDPELAALRAVNFTPDGTSRKRYDSNSPGSGIVPSNDTVDGHTHLEWWRDTAGTALRSRSITRIAAIMRAAILGQALEVILADEVRSDMVQVLVKGFQPDPNQIWLCDGMFRRKVNADWVGSATNGPITNSQTHQPGILGNLGWGGGVFPTGGDPNVWGVDISTFDDGDITLTPEQLQAIGETMAKEWIIDGEVVLDALESDRGQAALTDAANKAEDS